MKVHIFVYLKIIVEVPWCQWIICFSVKIATHPLGNLFDVDFLNRHLSEFDDVIGSHIANREADILHDFRIDDEELGKFVKVARSQVGDG